MDKNDQNNLTNDDYTQEHDPEDTHDNTQVKKMTKTSSQMMTIHKNMIHITHMTTLKQCRGGKNETDEYVTIGDINITSEMNRSNRESENADDEETEIRTNERYNLQPRAKNRVQLALAQSDKQMCTY